MAIGFTPKYLEEIPLNDGGRAAFLVRTVEVVHKLGWKILQLSESGVIAYTDKGAFSWNAELRVTIEEESVLLESVSVGSEMVDWGRNKKTVGQFLAAYHELESFSPEQLALKYESLKPDFVAPEDDLLKLPPATTAESIKEFLYVFRPVKGYVVTPVLMYLNILVFIMMAIAGVNIFEPATESLLSWGANFRPLTLGGQSWRLLTNCFLHIGILHLLMNMYALVYIGLLLEPYLGKVRFISAYLLTGITASIASLWWNDLTVSAGASGAIFGMYGVFLAMLTTNHIEKTARKALLTSIAVFVAFNLLNGVRGGIDNAAHIGGLIGGLIIGYAFLPSLKKEDDSRLKFGTIALMSFLILTSSFAVYKKMPNDYGAYDQKFAVFTALEAKALAVYQLPTDAPKEQLLKGLKENGVDNWRKSLSILKELDELNLPPVFQERNVMLKKYCELRIKSYDLAYKAIAENTEKYKDEMIGYNVEIQNLLNELTAQK
ncbi:rhomboid family intramembrane serine protease [Pedobacter sp. FW305-3-2-15-E-R2A2]|jgi:rhomboid protease GluP|uniref:rhomboid family intramembrane serine protease n=1 Tax=Pedobacter sp. FW305-3-2-15-E-R2A2 TaxID=3140251 RepID=UPI0031401040